MATGRSREGYVRVPGGKVWYKVVGSGGVPLVVVAGGPGAAHDYLEPLAALADERPVVFYDQLGAGNSDKPGDQRLWRNARFVDELDRVVDAVGSDRFHLLGHSYGTIFAVELALRQSARLRGLILAGPCLSAPRYSAGVAALCAALPDRLRLAIDRHRANGNVDAPSYKAAAKEFFGRHFCRLDPWPEAMTRLSGRSNGAAYATMWGPSEFLANGLHKDYDVTSRLGQIGVPTLYTCGRHDLTRPEETAWYHGLTPGSELVVFEESGHLPHLEEPERFLEVVRDFLRRAEAGSRLPRVNGGTGAGKPDGVRRVG